MENAIEESYFIIGNGHGAFVADVSFSFGYTSDEDTRKLELYTCYSWKEAEPFYSCKMAEDVTARLNEDNEGPTLFVVFKVHATLAIVER